VRSSVGELAVSLSRSRSSTNDRRDTNPPSALFQVRTPPSAWIVPVTRRKRRSESPRDESLGAAAGGGIWIRHHGKILFMSQENAPARSSVSPRHAGEARKLAVSARFGALATIAREPAGFPYGSLVALIVDGAGRPIFLLSRLAEHTQNLIASPDASVLLFEAGDPTQNPLEKGRVTLLGPCSPVPAEDVASCRAAFLAAHPDASTYVAFADFSFYRLEPQSVRYIAGFGRMSWVDARAYLAEPVTLDVGRDV